MQKLTHKGKDYLFDDLVVDHLDRFTDWAREQIPHPVNQVLPILKNLTPEQAKIVLEQATKEAAKVISTLDERVNSLTTTPEGRLKLMAIMLQDQHPMSDDDAHALMKEIYKEQKHEVNKVFEAINEAAYAKKKSKEAVIQNRLLGKNSNINYSVTPSQLELIPTK